MAHMESGSYSDWEYDVLGREGRGHELNTQYFLDGVKYLEAEERRQAMPTLFDVEGIAS